VAKTRPMPRLELYGFNNLTKSLSFSTYDVCYTRIPRAAKDKYIDGVYDAKRLTQIINNVASIVGAQTQKVVPVISLEVAFMPSRTGSGRRVPPASSAWVACLASSSSICWTMARLRRSSLGKR
jgi:hypothetical protein